jgi:hypothetical protein
MKKNKNLHIVSPRGETAYRLCAANKNIFSPKVKFGEEFTKTKIDEGEYE